MAEKPTTSDQNAPSQSLSVPNTAPDGGRRRKWSLGMLADKETDEVPGSVLLISKSTHNEPLGLQHAAANRSATSLRSTRSRTRSKTRNRSSSHQSRAAQLKTTSDGKIILNPQPDDSLNDPLNWAPLRRDIALLSLGCYCMIGGGMTPILAAGFTNVAQTYNVTVPKVALTTGLYMAGLGVGCVIAAPTAILFGKRPVYLAAIILFIVSCVWCALSPNYESLLVARIVQGISISPVECLPSATVAEIFFLHERAFRLGIYTLLLLGGKNLVPLVSAAIIQSLEWRWVFWIVAMIGGFCFIILALFVPETFWDRTPHTRKVLKEFKSAAPPGWGFSKIAKIYKKTRSPDTSTKSSLEKVSQENSENLVKNETAAIKPETNNVDKTISLDTTAQQLESNQQSALPVDSHEEATTSHVVHFSTTETPGHAGNHNHGGDEKMDPITRPLRPALKSPTHSGIVPTMRVSSPPLSPRFVEEGNQEYFNPVSPVEEERFVYTDYYRTRPPKPYLESLKPYSGRLSDETWLQVAIRPFILFAYPSVLWSSLVYSLSVGWLIVLSESVAHIYRDRETYNFTALQAGLVYISPFIGGILGTAVAGKASDVVVRYMSRRNGGVYEPEFRLVMGFPIALCTAIGLMGFGWSAEERDRWIVPTVFFGIISFGCSLGSTTAITFCVDSYREYASEALVTLNFSKNIFHGLVFSLFFANWLESDGSKRVFIVVGVIQLVCLLFTIPMYIYGKRARMWTVRANMMEEVTAFIPF